MKKAEELIIALGMCVCIPYVQKSTSELLVQLRAWGVRKHKGQKIYRGSPRVLLAQDCTQRAKGGGAIQRGCMNAPISLGQCRYKIDFTFTS